MGDFKAPFGTHIAFAFRVAFQFCYGLNTEMMLIRTFLSAYQTTICTFWYLFILLGHLSQGHHVSTIHVMVSIYQGLFSQSCFIEHLLHDVHMPIILLAVFIHSALIKCCAFVEHSFDDVHLSSIHLVFLHIEHSPHKGLATCKSLHGMELSVTLF